MSTDLFLSILLNTVCLNEGCRTGRFSIQSVSYEIMVIFNPTIAEVQHTLSVTIT